MNKTEEPIITGIYTENVYNLDGVPLTNFRINLSNGKVIPLQIKRFITKTEFTEVLRVIADQIEESEQ